MLANALQLISCTVLKVSCIRSTGYYRCSPGLSASIGSLCVRRASLRSLSCYCGRSPCASAAAAFLEVHDGLPPVHVHEQTPEHSQLPFVHVAVQPPPPVTRRQRHHTALAQHNMDSFRTLTVISRLKNSFL